VRVPEAGETVTRESFSFRVDRDKRKQAEWRDGHYLLRSNLTDGDPAVLWARYVQLTQIEAVFRSLKSELGIRPIYHQLEHPRGCAHFGGVSGLFVASNVRAPLADPCTGSNPGGGTGKAGVHSDDRRSSAHRRWSAVDSASLYPARHRR